MAKSANTELKDLEIKGRHKGDLAGRNVTIHERGSINGELGARSVVIKGLVKGIVRAKEIIVRSTAKVQGELRYETLIVDPGANFQAKCIPS